MEKIKINDIQMKGPAKTICVVNYNDGKEATLNTKWQEQEVDFLQKDVGIGGTVSVVIAQKGQYTNITEVDMNSAEKNMNQSNCMPVTESEKIVTPKPNDRYRTPEEMTAAEILKGAVELAKKCDGQELCELVNELTGAYKLALSNVKAL